MNLGKPSVTHHTFVIERSYPAPPETVFAAFADQEIKQRWFAEDDDHLVQDFQMDFRVGGVERGRFRLKEGGLLDGAEVTNTTTYQDIVPNRRIVFAYTMAFGDKPFSASLATLDFLSKGADTEILFTEQGAYFEGADGARMREAGWRQLLEQLAKVLPQ